MTNDYLPREAALRDYLQSAILQVYQNSGFERIMTPAIEDAENLDKSVCPLYRCCFHCKSILSQ